MERQKIKQIISILMESSLYFGFSPQERLEIVKGLVTRVTCEGGTYGRKTNN